MRLLYPILWNKHSMSLMYMDKHSMSLMYMDSKCRSIVTYKVNELRKFRAIWYIWSKRT